MSAAPGQEAGRPRLTLGLIGLIAVILALGFWSVRPPPPIERSALGFDGLVRWLSAQEMPARRYTGGGPLFTDAMTLRVLPLYDPNPNESASNRVPVGGEAQDPDLEATLRPIPAEVIAQKIEDQPTLLILPKWRDGVRRQGVRHEALLINAGADDPLEALSHATTDPEGREAWEEPRASEAHDAAPQEAAAPEEDAEASEGDPVNLEGARINPPLSDSVDEGGELIPLPRLLPVTDPVTETVQIPAPGRLGGGSVALAAPQYAQAGPGCMALLGDSEAGLVFQCKWRDLAFWVLSDPDLLNNHGLAEPDNQAFANGLFAYLRGETGAAPGDEIVMDYSTFHWVSSGEARGRSLSDLLRYVEPPFAWLWIAVLLAFAVALWRSGVRERPLMALFTEGYAAARQAAFEAQARLMRATGRDGALLRALAAAREAALCDVMLGQEERSGARGERMVAHVSRRDPDLGARLQSVLSAVAGLPDRVPADIAAQALSDLETVYQEALASAGLESMR